MAQFLSETVGFDKTEIGRAMTDARMVDFVVRDTVGIAGDLALKFSSIVDEKSTQKLGLKDIGLFTHTPAWASRDVQWIYDYAKRRKISTRSKELKALRRAIDAYNELNIPSTFSVTKWREAYKEKDRLAKELRGVASQIRERLEAREANPSAH